jgi:RNA polymerase sigma factor (sigma-70 family)
MRDREVPKGVTGAVVRQLDLLLRAGTTAGLSDEQLLARFAAREGGVSAVAFEALVRRHGPMVLATCRGVLRSEHDADDAFQATFLVLARRAATLRRGDRLGPWLHRVALRASERARVAAARRRDREAQGAELSVMVEPGPERNAEREELRQVVHQEVDRLPERYRVVLVLCDLQGESYEAAAVRLRVPVGTVRSRLSRARERLRVRINRRGLALPVGAAAALASGEAAAAVPAHLVATTVNLATLAAAGGLAAVPASTAALAYAEGVLKTRGLIFIGKTAAAVAVAGFGLTGVAVEVFALRGRPAAQAPAPAQSPAASPPVAVKGSERQEAEPLQGRWVVGEARQFGEPLDLVVGDRLVIEMDRFLWTAARGEPERIFLRGTTRGTVAFHPGAEPLAIDFLESSREPPSDLAAVIDRLGARRNPAVGTSRRITAIYRLEGNGDRLRLCVGDPDGPDRPRSFASEPGSRQLLLVFRRDGSGGRRGAPAALEGDTSERNAR